MKAVTMMTAKKKPDHIAQKYCFRAVVHLRDKTSQRIVGTFTGFDKTPLVAKQVQEACRQHIESKRDERCECTESQLLLYQECPVECSGDITFTFYES